MDRHLLFGLLAFLVICLPCEIAVAQATGTVSLDPANGPGNGESFLPKVSRDGRLIAFVSAATDLTLDATAARDVFLKDRTTGATVIASVDTNGQQLPNGVGTGGPMAISADGRYVAFSDLYVYDRNTATAERVIGPHIGSDDTFSMSSNGRYVAFATDTSFTNRDQNNAYDVYVLDRDPNNDGIYGGAVDTAVILMTERLVGCVPSGNCAAGGNYPSISADGRFVAFSSLSNELTGADTNSLYDVFVRDRDPDGNGVVDEGNSTTARMSRVVGGPEGNGDSVIPVISGDGFFVAFFSSASNLVAGDANAAIDVFLRNRPLGGITRVSVSTAGVEGNADSFKGLAISDTGRFIAFGSSASNLIAGDTNGVKDVFVRDTAAPVSTTIASADPLGILGNGASGDHVPGGANTLDMSGDGLRIVYESVATNLGSLDSNGFQDVFLFDSTPCRAGNVPSVGAPRLQVNGASGVVTVGVNSPVTVSLGTGSLGPTPAQYALYVWHELPRNQQELTVLGCVIGCTVNPTPFNPALFPQPTQCLMGNALPTDYCMSVPRPNPQPTSAPWSLTKGAGFPNPMVLTLQGVLQSNATACGYAVTNAVILVVQ